jgi:hypothetical protein
MTARLAGAWFAVVALIGATFVAAGQAQVASPSPPPLEENEVYVPLTGGCGVVQVLGGAVADKAAVAESWRNLYKTYVWTGPCKFGVAHGEGFFGPPEPAAPTYKVFQSTWMVYGRRLNKTVRTVNYTQPTGEKYTDTEVKYAGVPGKIASLKNLSDYGRPVWNDIGYSWVLVGGSYAYAFKSTCEPNKKYFRGCPGWSTRPDGTRWYTDVYGVRLVTPESPDGVVMPCPTYTNPAGCEGVWMQAIGKIRAEADAIIAASNAADEALTKRVTALYAPQIQAEADAAAAAERIRAAEAAEQASRAAVERAKGEAAFQAKLKTANSGELFALADDLKRSGQDDQARQALRSLVTRFPNSPLAPVAAQQMSGTPPQGAPASSAVASSRANSAGAVASSASAGWTRENSNTSTRAACRSEVAALLDAKRRAVNIFNGGPAWKGAASETEFQQGLDQNVSTFFGYPKAELERRIAEDGKYLREHPASQYAGDARTYQIQHLSELQGQLNICVMKERLRQVNGAAPPANSPGQGGQNSVQGATSSGGVAVAGCARTPDIELAEYNKEVAAIRARQPMPTDGARAVYQWTYAFTNESLNRLEPHRACLGPHYQANLNALNAAKNSARSGCNALAAQAGDCPLTYP